MGNIDKSYVGPVVAAAGAAVALVAVLVICFELFSATSNATFAQVAAFVLVGFGAFIMLMNVLSYAAYLLGIADATQPFGLPEGTVRAILTLSLMVLVGVLASFLITGRDHTQLQRNVLQSGVTQQAANDFAATLVKGNPGLGGSVTVVDASPKEADTSKKVFDVVSQTRIEDRLSEDISKQILTMLSTVLAAMIGFYFGARGDPSTPTPDDVKPSAESVRALDLQRKARATLAKMPDTTPEEKDRKAKVSDFVAQLGELRTRIEHWDIALAFPGASADAKAEAKTKKDEDKKQLDTIEAELGKLGV